MFGSLLQSIVAATFPVCLVNIESYFGETYVAVALSCQSEK
jgi:hypothetical protein